MQAILIKYTLPIPIALILAYIGKSLGGWDIPLSVYISMQIIDIITGFIVALIFKTSPKTLSGGAASSASFKGIVKKIVTLILIGMCVQLDKLMGTDDIRNLAIIYFITVEGLSILENVGLMGVKYPSFLKKMLEVLRDKNDKGEKGN